MRDIDPEDTERTPGFLTPSTRQYLIPEYDVNNPEDKRNQVKKRTRHAIADFTLLQQYAEEDLKLELVRSESDPPVFTGVETEQLGQTGLFFSEILIGQDPAEVLRQAMQDEEYQEAVTAGLSNDLDRTMQGIVKQISKLPISKKEAHAAIENNW